MADSRLDLDTHNVYCPNNTGHDSTTTMTNQIAPQSLSSLLFRTVWILPLAQTVTELL